MQNAILKIEVAMEWIKAEVRTTPYGAEIVTAVLLANNVFSVEIINPEERVRHLTETAHLWDYTDEKLLDVSSKEVCVIFYATKDARGEKLLDGVREGLAHLGGEFADIGTFELKTETANDETWINEWKKHFLPLRFGKVVVVPQWVEYRSRGEELVFRIDPGSAFGTGQHQSTQLCISALQEHLHGGERLLDIGCGSGILSIIGLLLGASTVFACDIDRAGAISATKTNATLNSIDISRLQIHSGNALSGDVLRAKICRNKYEVVIANIVADVVMELVPFVKEILTLNGVFIASGIIDERAEEVLAVFKENNMKVLQNLQLEGWHCIVSKSS